VNKKNVLVLLGVLCIGGLLVSQLEWRHLTTIMTGGSGERRPELAELVATVGTYRPFAARLTGGFRYGSIQTQTRSAPGNQELSPDLRIAIARIEKKAVGSHSDADWAALGTSYLVSGEPDRAVEFLEAAIAGPSPNPLWLSDLSAAYLTAGQGRDRHDLIPKALAAAEQACKQNGRLREALFNRALALEAIHLFEQAQGAWQAYRAIDQDSPWSQEALTHLTQLDRESAEESSKWANIQQALDARFDDRQLDVRSIELFRHRLRAWIETTVLPAWAARELTSDHIGAREQLRRARAAADWLMQSGGDRMPRDGIRAIDEASPNGAGTPLTARLARAHVGFRDVLQRFDDGAVAEANRKFQSIVPDFLAGRSPYAYWSAIYSAVAHYASRQFDESTDALNVRNSGDIDSRYRYLAGRRRWLSGLNAANEGHFLTALQEYLVSLADFQAVGESESVAAVSALLAENFRNLGIPGEAWRYQLSALAQLQQAGAARRKNLILQLGSDLCLNSDLPGAALHFQDAVLAPSSGNEQRPSVLVEGYLHRAEVLQRLGAAAAARDDLTRARALLSRIGDSALRRREEAEVFATVAQIYGDTRPNEAISSATRAIEYFRDPGGEARVTELHVARARAQAAAGRPELAENDLLTAIRQFEKQRGQLSDRQYKVSFFRDGWQAFADMVRLQLVMRKSPSVALEYAERGRARTLLEAVANSPTIEPLPVDAVRQRMPNRTAALFFVTLDDRLLVWTIRNQRIDLAERPIGAAALVAKIGRLRWLLRHSGGDVIGVRQQLEELYEQIVVPIISFVAEVDTIVVIPDGPLHSLPFAALVNPKTGRYLVQDFAVMTAPSLSTMVRFDASRQHQAPATLRALVFGNPAHQRTLDESFLPPLPYSQEEAVSVASMYREARLLTQTRATKREFLDNLGQYDVVHYAGHAMVNEQTPLMSRLVMAQDGSSENDGALFVRELAGVRLNRTRLVVLAACSTAAGMIGNGEGILSIARPFLEAGASHVIATLWDVPDRSAAELFQALHRHVAGGENPVLALARTQRQFIEHPDASWHAPSQWAWPVAIGSLP
jgi:CHAT domain-containing protein